MSGAVWGSPRGQIVISPTSHSLSGDSLTYEIKNRKSEEEEEALDELIEVMEKVLPSLS